MRVVPVPAFRDNYAFVLGDGPDVAVVDPGDAAPVLAYLQHESLRLAAVLVTHHHADHVGGLGELLARVPGVPVYAGAHDRDRVPGVTQGVGQGDALTVLGRSVQVIDVPGHTLGHVAYFFPDDGDDGDDGAGGDLFSGDTVFACTIGNLFEGTADQMFESLQRLRALPAGTRLWCAHEYTVTTMREELGNVPGDARLAARLVVAEDLRRRGLPTVPLSFAEELATNPFFRWDDPAVQARCGTRGDRATFRKLCE